ncbi:uncharacterized protein EI90DRAFT_3029355 [Cantharellus anzutake]|uniref:uncharacterized protein n=1 Tax=Cantharellus anzutake TaxID=1750568 RepID=UPI001907C22C|nr:uncharacterized protein EI90DRAFT_3029355 [Cantharellus anzutake]KAF8344349.1 hypothetical protein EI90DRAFT_3029355 [Cantharellus anzutake]
MRLQRIQEADEDADSVHQLANDDALSPGGSFPPGTIFLHGDELIEDESPESFFEAGLGVNVLHDIEPIEDDDGANPLTGAQQPSHTRIPGLTNLSNLSLTSVFSTFSRGSVLSLRSAGVTYSLKDLCDQVIEKHIWLQTARIISTSCYQDRNVIRHRYLILQLQRRGKKDIWMRIDRKAGLGILSLVRKGGKTRASDRAQLSASKEELIGRGRRENVQIFEKPPFLGDFGVFLRVISEELLEYKIWPENCWMFCSLLQEHLGISGHGRYQVGGPVARNIASEVRTRVSEQVAAHVTPITIMTSLHSSLWTFSPRWQPLGLAKPIGWLTHSIGSFLSKFAYPAQDEETRRRSHGILEWITNSPLVAHLEQSDLHSYIATHCIETLCHLPEENVLQLPNPLILNSDIPDLPRQIQSKISPNVQYSVLYGLLHVVEVENPSTELFSKLELFFAGSVIKWLEILSLLGATKNALVELDKIVVWYKRQSRRLQDQNLKESLLGLLFQCRRFTHQYYGVISASAGHTIHSALSHSPEPEWRRRYYKASPECLPTVRWTGSVWDGFLTIREHTGWVWSVSFSPDGSTVASASSDETIRIWDTLTGDELKVLRGHTGPVWLVSFSSDGSKLASASRDETVRIWDAETGDELNTLLGHVGWVWSVSFSPDGTRLASASNDRTVRVWDVEKGDELNVLRGHTQSVLSVSFSSDGSRLASASVDETVRIWDATTGDELKVLEGHAGWVSSVSFSSDGSRLASVSRDETVRIWDTEKGDELKALRGHTGWVFSVSFSSDKSRVASASGDGTVRVWDAVTGDELKVLRGHTGAVWAVSFSSDGFSLASASRDKTVRIWDAVTGDELKVVRGHTGWISSAAFSPDGSRVASASDDETVRIWDAVTGEELKVLRGHAGSVLSVSFSPDGSKLASASGDGTVRIWNAATGNELKVLRGHTGWVLSVSFSPDGSKLASVSKDETVRIWDVVTGNKLKVLRGHTGWVLSVSFSSDGSRLALVSGDEMVQTWDVKTGKAIRIDDNFIPYLDLFSDPSTCDCSFAEVKHGPNHTHLFIGACGTPHFIAPSHISGIITTWKMSHDRQALAISLDDGGLFLVQAPKIYRCVGHGP